MTTRAFSRRSRCRLVLALLALVLAAQAQSAAAGISWCKTDPKIDVGGHVAHIYIYSPNDILDSAVGPNEVVVAVPPGYAPTAQVLYMDNGFGFGHRVSFVESGDLKADRRGIQILVSILVPSSANSTSVKAELAGADGTTVIASKNGLVNNVIKVRGTI